MRDLCGWSIGAMSNTFRNLTVQMSDVDAQESTALARIIERSKVEKP